jgi:hypothetical protein
MLAYLTSCMEPTPDLAALIESIAEDSALLRSLSEENTVDGFAAGCVAAAEARGLRVTAADICRLIRAREIRWYERNAR